MSAVIPAVKGRHVYLFDCASLSWLPTRTMDLPSSDEFFRAEYDEARSVQALLLVNKQVLILYTRYTTTPYFVDKAGHVTKLANAIFALRRSGVLEFEGGIYLFGGLDGNSQSRQSQRLDLATGVWMPISRLSAERSNTVPTLWRNRIYISGEWECNTIDEYTPRTNTMVAIPVKLPAVEPLRVTFLDRDEMVVFSDFFASRFRKTEAGFQVVSKRQFARRLPQYFLQTNPVICDGKMFFVGAGTAGGWWADVVTSQELGLFKPAYID